MLQSIIQATELFYFLGMFPVDVFLHVELVFGGQIAVNAFQGFLLATFVFDMSGQVVFVAVYLKTARTLAASWWHAI